MFYSRTLCRTFVKLDSNETIDILLPKVTEYFPNSSQLNAYHLNPINQREFRTQMFTIKNNKTPKTTTTTRITIDTHLIKLNFISIGHVCLSF